MASRDRKSTWLTHKGACPLFESVVEKATRDRGQEPKVEHTDNATDCCIVSEGSIDSARVKRTQCDNVSKKAVQLGKSQSRDAIALKGDYK